MLSLRVSQHFFFLDFDNFMMKLDSLASIQLNWEDYKLCSLEIPRLVDSNLCSIASPQSACSQWLNIFVFRQMLYVGTWKAAHLCYVIELSLQQRTPRMPLHISFFVKSIWFLPITHHDLWWERNILQVKVFCWISAKHFLPFWSKVGSAGEGE